MKKTAVALSMMLLVPAGCGLSLQPTATSPTSASTETPIPEGLEWTVYTTDNSGLPRNEVFALAVDAQGSIRSGCWNGVGLTKFDGEAWTVYDTQNNGFAGRLSSSPLARQTHRAGPFARVRAISSNQCSSAVGF